MDEAAPPAAGIELVVPGRVVSQGRRRIRSSLLTVEIRSGRIGTVPQRPLHFEAPNWSRDGRFSS
jgi:hypothetical protein